MSECINMQRNEALFSVVRSVEAALTAANVAPYHGENYPLAYQGDAGDETDSSMPDHTPTSRS